MGDTKDDDEESDMEGEYFEEDWVDRMAGHDWIVAKYYLDMSFSKDDKMDLDVLGNDVGDDIGSGGGGK